jgi:hypothetical protein
VDTKQILWPGLNNKNPTIDVGFPEIDTLYAVRASVFEPKEYGSVHFWTERLDFRIRHPAHDARFCMHGPMEILRKGIWNSLHFLRWSRMVIRPSWAAIPIVELKTHSVNIIFSWVKQCVIGATGFVIIITDPPPDAPIPARFYLNI